MNFEDWPDCPVDGCNNKICLSLNSDKCFPHTGGNEHIKRWKIDARNAPATPGYGNVPLIIYQHEYDRFESDGRLDLLPPNIKKVGAIVGPTNSKIVGLTHDKAP